MSVMGLDLSLTGTGVVILSDDASMIYAATLKQKAVGMERLRHIKTEIKNILTAYEPTRVCVEGYSMGSRAGHAFNIGELGGIIRLMLYTNDYLYHDVAPTSLKKFVTGKGNSMKDEVMMHVYKNWQWQAGDNNQADAYGLARIAWCMEHADTTGLSKLQIQALGVIHG